MVTRSRGGIGARPQSPDRRMNRILRLLALLLCTAALLGNEECSDADTTPADDDDTVVDIDPDGDDDAPAECAPVEQLVCGQAVSGDTSDPNSGFTTAINGYPIAIGNYEGNEVAYSFTAEFTGELTWTLIDAEPSVLNHDLFVLDGACRAERAMARGFNSMTVDVVEGETYYLLLDAIAGEAGPFQARLECDGATNEDPDPVDPSDAAVDVIFSPQDYDASHIPATETVIDSATEHLDVAMYSFRDSRMVDAIGRATQRGVTVRAILESARADRNDPDGSKAQQLEQHGAEVRYVNKIMHHKFAMADGPVADLAAAHTARLATGSANWSWSAATKYDENTLFVEGDDKMVLSMQREFNLMWQWGRAFPGSEELTSPAGVEITQSDIDNADGSTVVMTSPNFNTSTTSYGPTFSTVSGRGAVRDALTEFIESADESLWIASGHLRSRQIVDAIRRLQQEKPDVDIRVYVDAQEYKSTGYRDDEEVDFDACLADASTTIQTQNCLDDGAHFSWDLHHEGVDVRFKYYAFRWHYSYAAQMHHKYLIVDGTELATGSYNLSNNAEKDTFENMMFISGERYPELVAEYVANFSGIWETGAGTYDGLLDSVENGTENVELVFPSMAIDWDQVGALKDAIRAACPAVDTSEFSSAPQSHQYCERQ
jgi:phosphatidylserine/phosphatidylglycerophosphate/cardiolipin synthase-like enzyme